MMNEDQNILSVKCSGEYIRLPATQHSILYKYFAPPDGEGSFAEANLKNLIVSNTIRLSSNKEVNDPSDSTPIFVKDHSAKDLEKHFHRMVTMPSTDPFTERERKKLARLTKNRKGRIAHYRLHSDKFNKAAIESPINNFRNSGFTCLTEEWSNRLMWSHYAQSHSGVCIGFRSRPSSNQNKIPFAANFLKIEYISDRPKWSMKAMLSGDPQKNVTKNVLFKKDEIWSYEKEWRFIGFICGGPPVFNGGDTVLIGDDEIVEVIFGMRSKPETKAKILNFLKSSNKNPKIYSSEFSNDTFSLVRKPYKST